MAKDVKYVHTKEQYDLREIIQQSHFLQSYEDLNVSECNICHEHS